MSRYPGGRQRHAANTLLCLLVAMCLPVWCFSASSKRTREATEAEGEDFTKPQLLNAATNPTLRYPAASFSGWSVMSISYGWFDVTRDAIQYTVVQPTGKVNERFAYQRSELSEVKLTSAYLTFKGGRKKHTIFWIAQSSWGSIHSGPGSMAAAGRGAIGTGSMLQAVRNFDKILAMVNPPPVAPTVAPQPAVTTHQEPKPVAPPVVALTNPPGAGSDKVVEVTTSSLVVRGVAMDNTGIPVVTINDSPVNMRPQSAQSTEFWSDPIQLQQGNNQVQIVASNSAHAQAKVAFTVHYTPPAPPPVNPRALDKEAILKLLNGAVSSSRVEELIKDRGIKFTPTVGDLAEIRAAGGTDELIQVIQQAAPSAK